MRTFKVFVTHDPAALENYYGARALQALQAIAHVRVSHHNEPWTPESLAAAAKGCDIILSDRRAEGSADLLERLPELLAFCRDRLAAVENQIKVLEGGELKPWSGA